MHSRFERVLRSKLPAALTRLLFAGRRPHPLLRTLSAGWELQVMSLIRRLKAQIEASPGD